MPKDKRCGGTVQGQGEWRVHSAQLASSPSARPPSRPPSPPSLVLLFLQNKGAVAAVFTIVGLVAAGLIFALVTSAIRRRKAKRFDREIAEEAKRAPAPVFVDDDDDYNGGYSTAAYGAGAGGYTDYGAAGHSPADAYAKSAAGHGPSSDGYPASNAVHSGEGTPSNYMYPSGYSDLGFSDVSSHGTYAQPPMDAYAAQGAGGAGYGAYGAAGMGAAGAGAGAYEMMGYGAHGGHTGYAAQQGQDWHAQNGQVQPQQAYVYPGEEQQGYPPAAPPPMTSHSTGSDLGRSKSGARSLVDSYGNTPPPDGSSGNVSGNGAAKPAAYADGYVSQYQTHVVDDDDAYGGVESHHGHVGNLEDEESDGEAGDGRRVLKVANN
ncbi:hypothetical protein C8R47DRAFT_1218903 [Mycena vitilis]|nr:hypothetical protein C8R47DRAFT_1218903 [Mycena vitilis]